MIPLSKLQDNLAQSVLWNTTFQNEVKHTMEELTIKNHQIAQLARDSLALKAEIHRKEGLLKREADLNTQTTYKADKLRIKIEEMQGRLALYQQTCSKREVWKQELTSKM